MFCILFRTMLTWASASDEVATLEPHTISAATDASFCDLCVNRLPEGVSGCRAEFYTNERLKKCGVTVGEPQRSCTQRAWAPPVTMRPGREKEAREKERRGSVFVSARA